MSDSDRIFLNKPRLALYSVLWLAPTIYICWLVYRYAVDVPFDDDFAIGDDICRWVSGTMRWTYLVAQHNESRPLFLRIVFGFLASHFRWDVRYQMVGSILLVTVTSLLSIRLALQTITDRRVAFTVSLLLNILWFSPTQWLNFLWGIQFITFVPALSLVVVILALGSPRPLWMRLLLSAVAAIVATYSNSNGLLVWIVPLPLFIVLRSRFRLIAVASWIALAAIAAGYYFYDYHSLSQVPIVQARHHLFRAIEFILAFLGNGVRRNSDVQAAIYAGVFILSCFGAAIAFAIIRCRSLEVWRRLLPWIILGSYSVASGVMAMVGRLEHFGLSGAVPERYPTFAIPIWLGVVPLWAVLLQHTIIRQSRRERAAILFSWGLSLLIVALTIKAGYSVRGDIRYYNARRLAGRTTAQFALVAPDDEAIIRTLCPGSPAAIATLQHMQQLRLLPFRLLDTSDLSRLGVTDHGVNAGQFNAITISGEHLIFSGWACLPDESRLADAVLLSIPDATGKERLFAVAFRDRENRPESSRSNKHDPLAQSGWTHTIDSFKLAPGTIVSAWAFDTYSCRAYRLTGTRAVPPRPKQ